MAAMDYEGTLVCKISSFLCCYLDVWLTRKDWIAFGFSLSMLIVLQEFKILGRREIMVGVECRTIDVN